MCIGWKMADYLLTFIIFSSNIHWLQTFVSLLNYTQAIHLITLDIPLLTVVQQH